MADEKPLRDPLPEKEALHAFCETLKREGPAVIDAAVRDLTGDPVRTGGAAFRIGTFIEARRRICRAARRL